MDLNLEVATKSEKNHLLSNIKKNQQKPYIFCIVVEMEGARRLILFRKYATVPVIQT